VTARGGSGLRTPWMTRRSFGAVSLHRRAPDLASVREPPQIPGWVGVRDGADPGEPLESGGGPGGRVSY
jgi:hypothetical protein